MLARGDDDAHTFALEVTRSQTTDSGQTACAEIDAVRSGFRERTSFGPEDVLGENLIANGAEQRICIGELADIRSVFRVEDADGQLGRREDVGLTGVILRDENIRDAGQVAGVERHADGQEAHVENRLALAERDLGLIRSIFRPDSPERADEPEQAARETSNDKVARTIEERDLHLLLVLEERIRLFDVLLECLLRQSSDGKHRRGRTFTTGNGIRENRRLERDSRERQLATLADVEEDADSLDDIRREGVIAVRSTEDDSRDDTLTVSRGTFDLVSKLTRREPGNAAADEVLHKLREANERQTEGAAGEVGDGRTGRRAAQPRDNVEAVGVV